MSTFKNLVKEVESRGNEIDRLIGVLSKNDLNTSSIEYTKLVILLLLNDAHRYHGQIYALVKKLPKKDVNEWVEEFIPSMFYKVKQ